MVHGSLRSACLAATVLVISLLARGVSTLADIVVPTPQILYAHGVRTPLGPRNRAFVATSANSIYAFDADDRSSAPQGGLVWHVTLRDPDATARPWGRGINATPILEFANVPADPRAGDNAVPFTAVYLALVPGR